MQFKPIKNDVENEAAIKIIEKLMDRPEGSLTLEESNDLEVLAILVQEYESHIEWPQQTPEDFHRHVNYHADRLIYMLKLDFRFDSSPRSFWEFQNTIREFVRGMMTGEG